MGRKDKNKKKGKGSEKTAMKTDKKLAAKQKKMLEKLGEANIAEVVATLEAEEARHKTVTDEICPPPSPRVNFTLVAHPDKEEIILFGGEFFNGQKVCVYNDLLFYNVPKKEWRQVRGPLCPTPRSGHQMAAVATDGGQLWVFGGEYASPSQLQYHHYKDLWVLRLKTRQWEKINAPNGPSARSGHRMVAAKKRLYVFGGFNDNNQSYRYFNDVHIFSLETYEWLKIEVAQAILPPPRSGCCISAYPDGKLLIWGGYAREPVKSQVDRGITHTDMFALVPDKAAPNKFKWTAVKPGGFKPFPRSSVGFTTAPNGKVYCFGGVMDVEENDEDVKGQFGDEIVMLDLSTQTWRLCEIAKKASTSNTSLGKAPKDTNMQIDEPPVVPPTITTDGVFTVTVGGPSSSSNSNVAGSKIPSLFPNRSKSSPSPRMNPGLCVCKGILYLFGGLFEEDNRQYTYNDFYALDLHKMDEWKVLIPNDQNAHDWIDSEDSDSDDESSPSDDDDDDDDDDDERHSDESDMETD